MQRRICTPRRQRLVRGKDDATGGRSPARVTSNNRSSAGNAFGHAIARIATYCTARSSKPGIARSAASVASSGAIGSSASVPSATACASETIASAASRATPIDRSAAAGNAASVDTAGIACASVGGAPSTRGPKCAARRASTASACVVARCSPTIARIAISTPSNAPGTRRPGEPSASSPRCASITSGRLSRSNSRRTRASTVGTTGVSAGDTVTASANRCGTCETDTQPVTRPAPCGAGRSTARR